MRNLAILLRVQIRAFLNALAPRRADGGRSHGGTIGLAAYVFGIGILVVVIVAYMAGIGLALASAGLARVIPVVTVLMGSLAGVALTFLKANGTLFGLRDYDHIMALPVPRRTVVLSRMMTLFVFAWVLALACMAPLYVVYFLSPGISGVPLASAGAGPVVAAALTVVLAPLAPTAVAAFLAYCVQWVASHFRYANLAYVGIGFVVVIAFVVGTEMFSLSAQQSDTEQLFDTIAQVGAVMEQQVGAFYPPAAWAAAGVVDGSWLGFAGFAAFSLAVPALCLEVMQREYVQLNEALAAHKRGGRDRVQQHAKTAANIRTRTPFWAIVFKEFRTLIGIPAYAFNCLFGYVFMIGIAGVFAFADLPVLLGAGSAGGLDPESEALLAMGGDLVVLLPWMLGFCAIMCDSPVVSISLEGRSAWIMATIPVSTRTMLGAKLASGALPCTASLGISIVLLLTGGMATPLVALECALVGFGAFLTWVTLGLSLDVAHPNFAWVAPNDVVKRGMPVMVCVGGGLFSVFLLGGIVAAASLALGLTAAHILNFAFGLALCGVGVLLFTRTVRKTPALYV